MERNEGLFIINMGKDYRSFFARIIDLETYLRRGLGKIKPMLPLPLILFAGDWQVFIRSLPLLRWL